MSHSRNSHRKYKISKRVYLQDTVCAHTCKLFHPSMQMTYLKWQVHRKKQGWLYFFPYMVICFLRDESRPCSETKNELSGTGVAGSQASPTSHPWLPPAIDHMLSRCQYGVYATWARCEAELFYLQTQIQDFIWPHPCWKNFCIFFSSLLFITELQNPHQLNNSLWFHTQKHLSCKAGLQLWKIMQLKLNTTN